MQSQGIPTVVAFRDGQPVSMFIGAYPEEEVDRFLDALLPTEAELEADEALAEEAAGDLGSAEAGYREALEKDPENKEAAVGLARILLGRSDLEGARALADPVVPDPDAERVMSGIRVREWASLHDGDPLAGPRRAAADGRWREALDGLLAEFDADPAIAREAMVDVFATLGDDPLVAEYRPKLAARLF